MKLDSLGTKLKLFLFPLTTSKAVIVIALAGLIVYTNMLSNGFVIDDNGQILANHSIRSIANIPNIFLDNIQAQETSNYYRPLPYSIYALLYSTFGESAFFYHLLQLSLHIGASILVFLIFRSWIKPKWALLLALIFVVHPVNQETVAYIANLQDILFVFFGLTALYLLQRNSMQLRYIVLANLALLLSLFSKETGVLFIGICLFYVVLFRRQKLLYQGIGSAAIVVIYAGIRLSSNIPLHKVALLPILQASLLERLMSMSLVLFYYFSTTFFPYKLSVVHTWVVHSVSIQNFFLPLLADIFIMALFVLAVLWLRKKGAGRVALFFVVWILLGLGFHLQVYPIDMTVADHYFYFTFIGLLGFCGLLIDQIELKPETAHILILAIVLLLGVFSARTMMRNADWKDQSTLITHDIQVQPNDYLLNLLYSTDLIQRQEYQSALPYTQKAIDVFPEGWLALNNLGAIYMMTDQPVAAKQAYQQSIKKGEYYGAYENLALLKLRTDPMPETNQFIKKSLEKYPSSQKLWYFRTLASFKLQDYDDALLAAERYDQLTQDSQSQQLLEAVRNKTPVNITF